jgi:hypothetical protein
LAPSDQNIWKLRAEQIRGRLNAIYARDIYYPVATLDWLWRKRSHILRAKNKRRVQPTCLPQVAWWDRFQRRKISLTKIRKSSGNVNLSELAILAQAAAECPAGTEIVEIGTFDGRTTVNLALNAPPSCSIFTLDLPPHQPTRFQLEVGERQFVEKPSPGLWFRQCPPSMSSSARRITQLFGDSATFDWSNHYGKAGLVFVDGSHAYEYACVDSITAMQLVTINGAVLWHDYGVWGGVTRALEDLERTKNLGLRHIRGTSLVLWRALGADPFKNRKAFQD